MEEDFLCYFAHSNKFYADTLNDLEKLKETYPELKDCSTCLGTAEEVRLFAQKILEEVKKRQWWVFDTKKDYPLWGKTSLSWYP